MDSRPPTATVGVEPIQATQTPSAGPVETTPATSCQRDLDVERGPNWLFVRVKGCRPSERGAVALAARVAAALDQHFVYRVVLEFEDATLPCDRLIAELCTLDQWVQDHNGVMRLCGLPAEYTRRFHRAHLTDRFPLYHDREEAVWGSHHPCQPR